MIEVAASSPIGDPLPASPPIAGGAPDGQAITVDAIPGGTVGAAGWGWGGGEGCGGAGACAARAASQLGSPAGGGGCEAQVGPARAGGREAPAGGRAGGAGGGPP